MIKQYKHYLSILSLIFLMFLTNITDISHNPILPQIIEKSNVPKRSYEWNLEGNILIDATATGVGAKNWTWAKTQDWCTGSGNLEDPYIIANLSVDGMEAGSAFTIQKSENILFEIRNCSFF